VQRSGDIEKRVLLPTAHAHIVAEAARGSRIAAAQCRPTFRKRGAMTFSIAKQGDTVTIGIEGHLVVGNRQALKQLVLDELARGERRFRVDFARTRYVDSSGLGVLVAMSKKVQQEHGTLSLTNLDEDLKTLFVLTKLDTLFSFEGEAPIATAPVVALPPSRPPNARSTAAGLDYQTRDDAPPP
jgi:anti-sigma B factor antagonist